MAGRFVRPATQRLVRRAKGKPVTEPILEIRKLNQSFGPVHVLHDVDFAVYPGQVTALVGDNGAGKSTLVKAVAGINRPDNGQILFEGKPVTIHDPRQASALGIEFVYQDLALADNLDITQNMFLGRETRTYGFLTDGKMEQRAREVLESLSVRTVSSVRQVVASLSGGQRQTVAIAKVGPLGQPRCFSGRADRRPRCRSDSPGSGSGSQTRRSGPWSSPHLAQHERCDGGC